MKTATAQHTPGPWAISEFTTDDSWLIVGVCPPHGKCQLARIPDAAIDDEYQANARLIAAAPELLEALETCCDEAEHAMIHGETYTPEQFSNRLAHIYEITQRAIAKARG